MSVLTLERKNIQIKFIHKPGILEICDKNTGLTFRQTEPEGKFEVIAPRIVENKICFTVVSDKIKFSAAYEIIDNIDQTPYIQLTMSSEDEFEGDICYPPAFDVYENDIAVLPYCEGVAFPVNSPDILLPQRLRMYVAEMSMSFWGITTGQKNDAWLLCAVKTNHDAVVIPKIGTDGLLRLQPVWEPQKGKWGYDRIMQFCIGNNGGITAMCHTYREFAKKKGFVVTLKEKVKRVPNIDKLVGSANVWLWNSDAMSMLYDPNPTYFVPTKEQLGIRKNIATEMKRNGMTRILWSIFNENVDKETVEYMNDLGYLTTFYDIYTDVIPHPIAHLISEPRKIRCKHRMSAYPDGIRIEKDGSFGKAWRLKGKDGNFYDQNNICDIEALKYAMNFIPKHTKETSLKGIFLDVVVMRVAECYHPNHPMTRSDAFRYKRILLQYLNDIGLVSGTEVGCEDVAANINYQEGMMSPPLYRAYDSGRRMTTLYYDDNIDEKIHKYMLNPVYRVPLWELVYHDCVVSYWYWGDSTNSCPELIKKRDLFCALYGLPALYSFDVADWEKLKKDIIASYHRTSDIAAKTGYYRMMSFEYVTDDKLVQKTTFENGIEVIANFSDKAVEYQGKIIDPVDKIVIGGGK